MVECQLPKLDVAGSSPVSRSIILMVPREMPEKTLRHFPFLRFRVLQAFRPKKFDEVAHSAGVAPLVVIPGQDFYQIIANDSCVRGIDD